MTFPKYEDLASALLCFIHKHGGYTFQVRSSDAYQPLANHFGLSQAERMTPRPDGRSGTHWANRVQWTRQLLINHGYAESRGHGIWGLTELGIQRARSISGRLKVDTL